MDTREVAFDVAIALAATAISFSIFLSLTDRAISEDRGDAVIWILLAVHGLSLVIRRIRPLLALSLNVASGLAVLALGWPTVVLGVALVITVYSIGAALPRRTSLIAFVVTACVVVLSELVVSSASDVSTRVGNLLVLAVAWFMGNTIRSRREYAANLERRNQELEAAREELAEKAVAEERVRIARELHDVIAHSMSLIAVQSGVGRRVIESDPAEAKRSLETIEDTSRTALSEVRRVLGLLRDQEEAGQLEPAPTLARLDDLIDQVEGTGLKVDVQRSGDLSNLSPGLELTIFRVVQEALTNVIKHASATRGRVVISRADGAVRIDVVDDGRGETEHRDGTGLRGMRERVEAFGGTVEAGGLAEGGFRVAVSIPAEGAS
jgi:signal transduction histidine kinase